MKGIATILVALLSTAGMLAAVTDAPVFPVRAPLGLVLAAFAPGYGLLLALQPTRVPLRERLALSVPISLALVVPLTAAFDHTPLGLAPLPIVLAEWAVSVALLGIGAFRLGWFGEGRLTPPRYHVSLSPKEALRPAVFVALLVVVGGWSANSIAQAAFDQPKPFTRLSLDNHASAVTSPRVVIQNEEGQPMVYDVAVDVAGRRMLWVPGLALAPGDQFSAPLPDNPDQQAVDVVLFRAGDDTAYRRLHIPATEDPASD